MASRRRSEFLICPSRGSRSRQTSTAEGCCPEFGSRQEGYIEGQNLTTEYRFAEEQYERLPELAVDLVGRHVALIVASGSPPVVPDYLQQGTDLARPGQRVGDAIEHLAANQDNGRISHLSIASTSCTAPAWRRDTNANHANSLSAALYHHVSGRLVRLFRQPIGLTDGR